LFFFFLNFTLQFYENEAHILVSLVSLLTSINSKHQNVNHKNLNKVKIFTLTIMVQNGQKGTKRDGNLIKSSCLQRNVGNLVLAKLLHISSAAAAAAVVVVLVPGLSSWFARLES